MNQLTFSNHAKCILTGEHAVIRNHPAIVFPLHQFNLRLSYIFNNKPLTADCLDENGESLLLMFWGTLKKALEMVKLDLNQIKGHIEIENYIPPCAGLGFSAALCIVIGRWFVSQKWLKENKLFEFARTLEDKFHQESSGADIAGVVAEEGIYYRRNKLVQPLRMKWRPHLYLCYSEHISVTAEAVESVKKMFEANKFQAKRIDIDMAESVAMAKAAFQSDEQNGLALLAKSLNQARLCFEQWGLITNKLQMVFESLRKAGALAYKPTGAGFGGYVLSLWQEKPNPELLPFEMHSVF